MGILAFKALHLIAMVAWFAGLFYIFRLYVYHVENKDKPDSVAMLKVMEKKLLKIITVPAMVITLIGGFAMLGMNPGYAHLGWVQVKLLLVALLVAYTFYVAHVRKRFEKDDIFLTSKQCRLINEIPTPLLIGIVLLAVYRP